MSKTLDAARTTVAWGQVALAGMSTVYIGLVFAEGISELREERKERKARKASAKNTHPENDI